MHSAAMEWIARYASKTGRVLDVGGRDVNGSPRHLFGPDYTVLDIAPGPGVDIVADAANLITTDWSFDIVVCAEVLEHTQHWREVLAGCAYVLAPGGRLIVTAAGPGRQAHSAISFTQFGRDEWYENIDPGQLADWLVTFGLEGQVDVLGTDVRAIATRPVNDSGP